MEGSAGAGDTELGLFRNVKDRLGRWTTQTSSPLRLPISWGRFRRITYRSQLFFLNEQGTSVPRNVAVPLVLIQLLLRKSSSGVVVRNALLLQVQHDGCSE